MIGDCILISCPKSKEEMNPESNWYLVLLESNGLHSKIKVNLVLFLNIIPKF